MLRFSFFYSFAFLLTTSGFAQELIKNGGFEEFYELPDDDNQIYRCKGMSGRGIDQGTPDYMYKNSGENCSFQNWLGNQLPYEGNAYAAIIQYSAMDAREYLQMKLAFPLLKDSLYELEFYVSLADFSGLIVENLGATFVDHQIFESTSEQMDKLSWLIPIPNSHIEDTTKWHKKSIKFRAVGNEKYLILGRSCALDKNNLKYVEWYKKTKNSGGVIRHQAACYIDNVSLIPVGWNYKRKIHDIPEGNKSFIEFIFEIDSSKVTSHSLEKLKAICSSPSNQKLKPILLVNGNCPVDSTLLNDRVLGMSGIITSCGFDQNEISILYCNSLDFWANADKSLRKYKDCVNSFFDHCNGQIVRAGQLYDIGVGALCFVKK